MRTIKGRKHLVKTEETSLKQKKERTDHMQKTEMKQKKSKLLR